MIRVAAVADVHFGLDSAGTLAPRLEHLADQADVLLLAGDLTTCGNPDEAAVLADELRDAPVPVVTVLGNHDYHLGRQDEVRARLERGSICVLEGESATLEVDGQTLAVVGVKGFGGGFAGATGTDFGEDEMKAFMRVTYQAAERLQEELSAVRADIRIALMHYAPVKGTLRGERLELYPFLGSYLLGEAVDTAGAELVLHGHAHGGTEKGATPGGIHVRNVAMPVIRHPYNVYALHPKGETEGDVDARRAGGRKTAEPARSRPPT